MTISNLIFSGTGCSPPISSSDEVGFSTHKKERKEEKEKKKEGTLVQSWMTIKKRQH